MIRGAAAKDAKVLSKLAYCVCVWEGGGGGEE